MNIQYAQLIDVQAIEDAFVLIDAKWSMPSRIIKRHFTEWFESNLYAGEVIIVDIDAIDATFQGRICHGNGAVCHIRNGQIVAFFEGNLIFEKNIRKAFKSWIVNLINN